MSKPNGGPAFPSIVLENPGEWATGYPGMSLRQWYAGMALQGWIAAVGNELDYDEGTPEEAEHFEAVAKLCHGYADAMIAEGERER